MAINLIFNFSITGIFTLFILEVRCCSPVWVSFVYLQRAPCIVNFFKSSEGPVFHCLLHDKGLLESRFYVPLSITGWLSFYCLLRTNTAAVGDNFYSTLLLAFLAGSTTQKSWSVLFYSPLSQYKPCGNLCWSHNPPGCRRKSGKCKKTGSSHKASLEVC